MVNRKHGGYSNDETGRCTITIDKSLYNRLIKLGDFGESFNKLITRLLDATDAAKAG